MVPTVFGRVTLTQSLPTLIGSVALDFGSEAEDREDLEPRLVDAVAAEETRLLRLDREDFFDLLSEQFDITQKIFQSIVGRLKSLIQ